MLSLPATLRASSRSILSHGVSGRPIAAVQKRLVMTPGVGKLLDNIVAKASNTSKARPTPKNSTTPAAAEAISEAVSEPVKGEGELGSSLHEDNPPTAGNDGYPPAKPTYTTPRIGADKPSSDPWGKTGADSNEGFDNRASSVPRLKLHCHSTPNNTITTLTQANGSTIAWFSGGSCGFRKGNRATYEAGYQCAVRAFKKIEELNKASGGVQVDLFFKGFGEGRNALKTALLATEGAEIRNLVTSITDRTPIKIGGTRAKKMQRN